MSQANPSPPLLRLAGLTKTFKVRRIGGPQRIVHAVADLDLDVGHGETVALIGESGSGKTTAGRMALRLLAPDRGTVEFAGIDITDFDRRRLHAVRRDLQVVLQDPAASMNPRMRVREIVAEPLRVHRWRTSPIRERVEELLNMVGLSMRVADRYPFEFSGGQRQRISIARALATQPRMVVLDEPVSALDVSVQAQILNLLADLQTRHGHSYLFISHDLAVVSNVARRVAVMYAGRIVEQGEIDDVFRDAGHPYTRALLAAIPLGPGRTRSGPLLKTEGSDVITDQQGCAFSARCPLAAPICREVRPILTPHTGLRHDVACHFSADVATRLPDPTLPHP